jgi:hypothetical protein
VYPQVKEFIAAHDGATKPVAKAKKKTAKRSR